MLEWLQMEQWSPYAVGIGIGILSWFSFLLSDKHVSCSTALTRTSGMVEKLFRGKKVEDKEYYKKFPPKVQWDWMLLVGVLIGAFISTMLSVINRNCSSTIEEKLSVNSSEKSHIITRPCPIRCSFHSSE